VDGIFSLRAQYFLWLMLLMKSVFADVGDWFSACYSTGNGTSVLSFQY